MDEADLLTDNNNNIVINYDQEIDLDYREYEETMDIFEYDAVEHIN